MDDASVLTIFLLTATSPSRRLPAFASAPRLWSNRPDLYEDFPNTEQGRSPTRFPEFGYLGYGRRRPLFVAAE